MKKYVFAAAFILASAFFGLVYLKLNDAAAIVGLKIIPTAEVDKDYESAQRYFKNVSGLEADKIDSPEFQTELKRAVIDKLIENEIVLRGLFEFADGDFQAIALNKIESALKDADISRSAEFFYGLSQNEFKERVLLPQAYREILEGRLFLKKISLSDWLTEAKRKASVVVFLEDFSWDGNRVIIKQ